ncbi:hypothetical protein AVEN_117470-1 [Araneus ventricosus]|uniref:Uncharacterized protein n=1 Tax=Araneus ventricosus TaxID=182803 RepID=A0A4Y2HU75_ARAVE|nr:hypothetical protein AVEN_117470-1 [Araneus ventricosus]
MSNCRKSCAPVVFPLGNERFLHQQQSYGEAFGCDETNPVFMPIVYFMSTPRFILFSSNLGVYHRHSEKGGFPPFSYIRRNSWQDAKKRKKFK